MTEPHPDETGTAQAGKPLGFWTCWSLTVGVMIGSGIFALPAVLAPYGLLSFGGWLVTGAGAVLLALTIGRLASRTKRSGGPYVYAHDAFGDVAGFFIAWGYWASYWIAIPAVAIAFVGYLSVFLPGLKGNALGESLAALALIWTLTLVALRGVREAGAVQIVMTVLKLIPLMAIIGLGLVAGDRANLPPPPPPGAPLLPALAATALLTMWSFTGLEAGCLPAGNVKNPERTIPAAVIVGTISVVLIYLASSAAVMTLVPAQTLMQSTSPFADAARGFGSWGPAFVAVGALVSTAGALNGIIFISGQLPMAVALDKLAPPFFARINRGGSPHFSLIVSATLGSLLLFANYARGLTGAFTFLLMMSTVATLVPYLTCAAAELRHSIRSAKGWAAVALLAGLYSVFAILGSSLEVAGWGVVLFVAGVPLYWFGRADRAARVVKIK